MSLDNDNYEPSLSKGYPPAPLPGDWWVRLGRLEDRTGVSLEDFTRRWGLPLERANRLRFHDAPHRRRDAGHHGVGLLGAGRRRGAAAGLGRTLALPELGHGTPPAVCLPHPAGAVSPGLPRPAGPLPAAAGFTGRGLARELRVNDRTVRRWKAGSKVGSGHLVSLFALAARLGLLHHLLPEAGEPVAAAGLDARSGGCAGSLAIHN